jgi:thymidylate kinase
MSPLPKTTQIDQKEKQEICTSMHTYLRTTERYDPSFFPPPVFIELTGSPSSGKSTVIKKMDDFLRGEGFRVLIPQEGAEVIRHVPRTTPLYNIRTGLYALELLIDQIHGHNYDVIIFDRCIFDVDNWMAYWEDKQLLFAHESRMIQDFFRMRFWVDHIAAAFILTCDPEVAIKRDKGSGQYTNPETIRKLNERYRLMHQRLSPEFPQLEIIDTTAYSAQEMVELMTAKTLRAIAAHIAKFTK